MNNLCNELISRFPEILSRVREGDEELPYVVMGFLAKWLKKMPADQVTPALLGRVAKFARWCEQQPSSTDAEDDTYTILVVGFYEELFDSDSGRALLPHLIPHEDVVRNADYLRAWVGPDNYEKALTFYKP
jgi:hypothetical protein